MDFPSGPVVKECACIAGDAGNTGLIPEWGRSQRVDKKVQFFYILKKHLNFTSHSSFILLSFKSILKIKCSFSDSNFSYFAHSSKYYKLILSP